MEFPILLSVGFLLVLLSSGELFFFFFKIPTDLHFNINVQNLKKYMSVTEGMV